MHPVQNCCFPLLLKTLQRKASRLCFSLPLYAYSFCFVCGWQAEFQVFTLAVYPKELLGRLFDLPVAKLTGNTMHALVACVRVFHARMHAWRACMLLLKAAFAQGQSG